MITSSDHFIDGNDSSIFERLENPHTMGAIWRGAFSVPAMKCAQHVVERKLLNIPGNRQQPMADVFLGEEPSFLCPLVENLRLVKGLFSAIGSKLLHRSGVFDQCRVEPAHGNQFTRNAGPWHVDTRGRLVGLAVVAGITSELLPIPIPGTYDQSAFFTPDDPALAERIAHSMDNTDFAILKAADFPHPQEIGEKGLVHRRPNAKLESRATTARMVIQYKTL